MSFDNSCGLEFEIPMNRSWMLFSANNGLVLQGRFVCDSHTLAKLHGLTCADVGCGCMVLDEGCAEAQSCSELDVLKDYERRQARGGEHGRL